MAAALTERRRHERLAAGALRAAQATLRPGCPVMLVDVSAAGARVQSERPLRPGSRVHVRLSYDAATVAAGARVLWCLVWALEAAGGVTYHGGLQFEEPCAAVSRLARLAAVSASSGS